MNNPAFPQSSNIEIYPLQSEHLDFAVDLHLQSYQNRTNFSRMLGREFVKKTYKWFYINSERFGFIAFVDKEPAGVIIGAEYMPSSLLNKYRFKTALYQVFKCPWVLFSASVIKSLIRKLFNFTRCNKSWEIELKKGEFIFLYSLAVLSHYAKYRIANLLLQEVEKYAEIKNKKYIVAPVGGDNISALTLYRLRHYNVDRIRADGENKFLYKKITPLVAE